MERSKKISWQAMERISSEKTSDWFWGVGIVAFSIAILAFYFEEFLLAIVVLLIAITLILQSKNPAQFLDYEINRMGIKAGDVLYSYSSLISFWVIDEDGIGDDRIIIKSKKVLMPLIIIPLAPEVIPDQVREYLLEYLNEEHLEEPFLQKILEIWGI